MSTGQIIRLDELNSLYGADSVKELLGLSLSEARTLIAKLQTAVPAKDSQSVIADAHQLKGMAATMTIDRMAELSKKLEHAAKDNTWNDSPQILSEIQSCFQELEQYLKANFPGLE